MGRWRLYWTVGTAFALVLAVTLAWASPAVFGAALTVAIVGWAVT